MCVYKTYNEFNIEIQEYVSGNPKQKDYILSTFALCVDNEGLFVFITLVISGKERDVAPW